MGRIFNRTPTVNGKALALGDAQLDYAYTIDPSIPTGQSGVGTANRAYYQRVMGKPVTTNKLYINVAASGGTGNISVAVYASSGVGINNAPTTRLATTGAIATPATGLAEVTLGSTIDIIPGVHWLAFSCDSTTPTFTRQSHGTGTQMVGRAVFEASAHPCPSTAGSLSASFGTYLIIAQ